MADIEKQNRARKAEITRQWRINNPDILHSHTNCICGVTYTYNNKSNHLRSGKHIQFMKRKEELDALHNEIARLRDIIKSAGIEV